MNKYYKNQYSTIMNGNGNENNEGIVWDEINRLLPIIKLKELYRYKSALVHYRYDFTPRVECTVAELAWGFVRDPCYANQVAEKLIEVLPDIRDEPPVFVTEWDNIVTTVTTSLQGPSIVKSEAVMDSYEEVVEVEVNGDENDENNLPPLEEDIDYSDVPRLEPVRLTFDIENQLPYVEQVWVGDYPEGGFATKSDSTTIDLSNLYAVFEEFRANRDRQDKEIDDAKVRLAESMNVLRRTVENTEKMMQKKPNEVTVRVFTEFDLKKNGGMDLAKASVLPRNQTFSVPNDATWAETVAFEVEQILGKRIYDTRGVYVFVDRVNGTIRPIDLIVDYNQMQGYKLLNGEVWLFVSESPIPKSSDEICVHMKWVYKNHFWYQGTKILDRFLPISAQLPGKEYLYEEITAIKGEELEVNKIDSSKCPCEYVLGNGDILIYSKNQNFSQEEVKESISIMLENEENKKVMRERFFTELGSQI